jgi:hypothetical protein
MTSPQKTHAWRRNAELEEADILIAYKEGYEELAHSWQFGTISPSGYSNFLTDPQDLGSNPIREISHLPDSAKTHAE